MEKILIIFLLVIHIYALPTNKDVFDKKQATDIEINFIQGDEFTKIHTSEVTTPNNNFNGETTAIYSTPSLTNTHIGNSFVSFIDDVFQIPITVLQSVAKLLRNPFRRLNKTPEQSSKY